MKECQRQLALFTIIFLAYSSYTMVGIFLPNIADSQGASAWMIGLIFSTDPIIGLIVSIILGKYMWKIGRKLAFLSSAAFTSLSILTLCAIEYTSLDLLLVLSFISRIFSGISQGCIMTVTFSLMSSEYPDRIETMIARSEMTVGLSLIAGSLMGSLFYELNLLYSLLAYGIFIALLIPLCSYMIGDLKLYERSTEKLGYIKIALKPVLNI
jgi:MFS family permease